MREINILPDKDTQDQAGIRYAASIGDIDAIALLLLQEKNKRDTPLSSLGPGSFASSVENNGKLETSVINEPDIGGNTPLHYAVLYGKSDAVSFLLENKADFKAINQKEIDALDLAITLHMVTCTDYKSCHWYSSEVYSSTFSAIHQSQEITSFYATPFNSFGYSNTKIIDILMSVGAKINDKKFKHGFEILAENIYIDEYDRRIKGIFPIIFLKAAKIGAMHILDYTCAQISGDVNRLNKDINIKDAFLELEHGHDTLFYSMLKKISISYHLKNSDFGISLISIFDHQQLARGSMLHSLNLAINTYPLLYDPQRFKHIRKILDYQPLYEELNHLDMIRNKVKFITNMYFADNLILSNILEFVDHVGLCNLNLAFGSKTEMIQYTKRLNYDNAAFIRGVASFVNFKHLKEISYWGKYGDNYELKLLEGDIWLSSLHSFVRLGPEWSILTWIRCSISFGDNIQKIAENYFGMKYLLTEHIPAIPAFKYLTDMLSDRYHIELPNIPPQYEVILVNSLQFTGGLLSALGLIKKINTPNSYYAMTAYYLPHLAAKILINNAVGHLVEISKIFQQPADSSDKLSQFSSMVAFATTSLAIFYSATSPKPQKSFVSDLLSLLENANLFSLIHLGTKLATNIITKPFLDFYQYFKDYHPEDSIDLGNSTFLENSLNFSEPCQENCLVI